MDRFRARATAALETLRQSHLRRDRGRLHAHDLARSAREPTAGCNTKDPASLAFRVRNRRTAREVLDDASPLFSRTTRGFIFFLIVRLLEKTAGDLPAFGRRRRRFFFFFFFLLVHKRAFFIFVSLFVPTFGPTIEDFDTQAVCDAFEGLRRTRRSVLARRPLLGEKPTIFFSFLK